MATAATPEQWFTQIQGTMDALLRTLGEVIATHPAKAEIITLLSIQAGPHLHEPVEDQPRQGQNFQQYGQEQGIRAVLVYVRTAEARAAAMKADSGGTAH